MVLVSLTGIKKEFVSGEEKTVVLSGLELEAEKGEMVMIMGPSGSGKTTLLNILGGIDQPDNGTVKVAGDDLHALDKKGLNAFRRQKVGFIFQFYNLLPTLTALENVELGLETTIRDRKERRKQAQHYLGLVDLADKLNSFPQELSGGEQQRVAVARALAREPDLVLADEPTGNLDGEREESVMTLMKKLQKDLGITFFIVSHNQELRQYADRVLMLRRGTLEASA